MNKKEHSVEAAFDSGIEPVTMVYRPIRSCISKKLVSINSEMILNSTVLGRLNPDKYEIVAERTVRSEKLAVWGLTYITRALERLAKSKVASEFLSMRVPIRAAKKSFVGEVERFLIKGDITSTEGICFEFPAGILYENINEISPALIKLKSLGISTMVSGFGDEFCPVIRLSELPFDYVMLHPYQVEKFANRSSAVAASSLVHFIASCGAKPIASYVNDERALNELHAAGCIGYLQKEPMELTEFADES